MSPSAPNAARWREEVDRAAVGHRHPGAGCRAVDARRPEIPAPGRGGLDDSRGADNPTAQLPCSTSQLDLHGDALCAEVNAYCVQNITDQIGFTAFGNLAAALLQFAAQCSHPHVRQSATSSRVSSASSPPAVAGCAAIRFRSAASAPPRRPIQLIPREREGVGVAIALSESAAGVSTHCSSRAPPPRTPPTTHRWRRRRRRGRRTVRAAQGGARSVARPWSCLRLRRLFILGVVGVACHAIVRGECRRVDGADHAPRRRLDLFSAPRRLGGAVERRARRARSRSSRRSVGDLNGRRAATRDARIAPPMRLPCSARRVVRASPSGAPRSEPCRRRRRPPPRRPRRRRPPPPPSSGAAAARTNGRLVTAASPLSTSSWPTRTSPGATQLGTDALGVAT